MQSKYVYRRIGKPPRGIIAVEMALILPVMLALMLGVAELGRLVYTYNSLLKSLRVAARHMSMFDPTNTAAWNSAQATAKNLAVCGNVSSCDGMTPTAPNFKPDMVLISPLSSGAVRMVAVRISGYVYTREFGHFTWNSMRINNMMLVMRTL